MGLFSRKPAPPSVSVQIRDALVTHLAGTPGGDDRDVVAVLVEVQMDGGLDLVAAFPADGAHYYNHSGRSVVWSAPGLEAPTQALLTAGAGLFPLAGLWEGGPLPPLAKGDVRLSVFTARGHRFGQGPMDVLGEEPAARQVLEASFALMQALIAKAQAHGKAQPS